jgi:hypothetical protein
MGPELLYPRPEWPALFGLLVGARRVERSKIVAPVVIELRFVDRLTRRERP